MAYEDAASVLAVMRDHLPGALAGMRPGEIEAEWPRWVKQRDAEIRGRIARGDEDTLVNLWLYGTTFTNRPPARQHEFALLAGRASMADVLEGRLDDLIAGIVAPGSNERLRFSRDVVERRGIDPTAASGRAELRRFLVEARERVLGEFASTDRVLAAARESAREQNDPSFEIAAYAAIFQDRGLASDTSILPLFGIEQVLAIARSLQVLEEGSVRRVAIVGPGLDFINKADGYDFYPPQTMQPFAIVDSLTRLGLARAGHVQVTTLDVNPRVNEHIEAASRRAQGGQGYLVQLPLPRTEPWDPALVTYWERLGDRVGKDAEAAKAPAAVADLTVRAVLVRPEVVRSIRARDLNIVVQRLEPLAFDERFDLVVATNVLVYYEPFEQSLALANAAAMLRPGGVLLANSGVVPAPPLEQSSGYVRVAYSDRQYDHFFWYRRESDGAKAATGAAVNGQAVR
jgi:SAM-dependent methyltransferase